MWTAFARPAILRFEGSVVVVQLCEGEAVVEGDFSVACAARVRRKEGNNQLDDSRGGSLAFLPSEARQAGVCCKISCVICEQLYS